MHLSEDEAIVRRILDDLPEGASVERIEFSADGMAVTLWSRSVGSLLGRRGATAERIRAAIDGGLPRNVQLNVGEVARPYVEPR